MKPQFDDAALAAVLQPAPPNFDRAHRVRLLGEAGNALVAGELPSREAALLLGGALVGWLREGGDLERDFLKVSAKAGSHHTPAVVWQEISSSRGATGLETAPTIPVSLLKSEKIK